MASAVRQYVGTCNSCQRNKAFNLTPAGVLRPLPIPTEGWLNSQADRIKLEDLQPLPPQ
jgi:hypothetical protein